MNLRKMRRESILVALLVAAADADVTAADGSSGDFGTGPSLDDDLDIESGSTPPAQPPFGQRLTVELSHAKMNILLIVRSTLPPVCTHRRS